jgi:predicted N-acetyltransferase YhbS
MLSVRQSIALPRPAAPRRPWPLGASFVEGVTLNLQPAPSTPMSYAIATEEDAAPIAALRTATSQALTRTHGQGHWSRVVTERAARLDIRTSRVLVARDGQTAIGTVALALKKPWAIDLAHFTAVPLALYLRELAVAPDRQRRGLGRDLVREAISVARAWPSQAIRLDAYDAPAGAGAFYLKCGFREVGRVTYRKVPLIYFELLL